eukprot:12794092-Alexandrium_andersonii.AAC.1
MERRPPRQQQPARGPGHSAGHPEEVRGAALPGKRGGARGTGRDASYDEGGGRMPSGRRPAPRRILR